MKNKVVINKASSPKVVIGDLQRSVILETATTTTHVEDSRQRHSGMTTLFNGLAFTLIELLVVVLIIGILAAVAVPQYQKVVDLARLHNLIAVGATIVEAEESYYLANNEYTSDWNNLDIRLPGPISGINFVNDTISSPDGWKATISKKATGGTINATILSDTRVPGVELWFAYLHDSWKTMKRACYAEPDNARAVKLCQHISKKKQRDETGGGKDIYSF